MRLEEQHHEKRRPMNARDLYKKCYSDIRYHDTIPLEGRDSDDLTASLRTYPKFIQDAAWDTYFKRHREFTGFRRAWMKSYYDAKVSALKHVW